MNSFITIHRDIIIDGYSVIIKIILGQVQLLVENGMELHIYFIIYSNNHFHSNQ